jgi:hypothetical protein
MSSPAFAPLAALPTRSSRAASVNILRCSVPEADANFPVYQRNAAPHISFSGTSGIFFSMKRVEAFTEDTGEPPLFEYGEKNWAADKPTPPNSIAWPGGDGRAVEMTGSRGSFTVGDEKSKFSSSPKRIDYACSACEATVLELGATHAPTGLSCAKPHVTQFCS